MSRSDVTIGKYQIASEGKTILNVFDNESKAELDLVDGKADLGEFLTEMSRLLHRKGGVHSLPECLAFVKSQCAYASTFACLEKAVQRAGVSIFVDEREFHPKPVFGLIPISLLKFSNGEQEELRLSSVIQSMPTEASPNPMGGVVDVIGYSSQIVVTNGVREEVERRFADGNIDVIRLTSRGFERTFVYLDVSDFSVKLPSHQQAIIRSLIDLKRSRLLHRFGPDWSSLAGDLESTICIGDGFIYVFEDAFLAVKFACTIACWIERWVSGKEAPEFHFRIGIHTGVVKAFWDESFGDDGESRSATRQAWRNATTI